MVYPEPTPGQGNCRGKGPVVGACVIGSSKETGAAVQEAMGRGEE
jgi:hypothetical protein